MKPLKLVISGWGPYAEQVDVDFAKFDNQGLFLITGPTGGGKTTIFDAISFALYGDVSGKNRDKTSVRSDFAKPDTDTFIELVFEHKNNKYRIRRSPKYERPKKRGEGYTVSNETAELYVNEEPPIASVTEVNRELEQIMGINYSQFKQIAMIAQGEFLELLVASSRDRVEIFRNLFHTEDYDKLQRNLSYKSRELLEQIKALRERMKEAIVSLEVLENSELESLVKAEDYQYENIIKLGKDFIDQDKKTIGELEKLISQKETSAKQILIKINEGELQNQKIQLWREILIELGQLNAQKDQIERWKQSLQAADRAEKAAAEVKILLNLKNRRAQLIRAVDELQQAMEVQLPRLNEAELDQKKNNQRKQQLEEWKEKERVLEGLLPLLKEYDLVKKTQKSAKDQCDLLKEKEDKLNLAIDAIKSSSILLQDELLQYEDVEIKIGQSNLELEKQSQLIVSLEHASRQMDNLQEEQQKLSSLGLEYSQAEFIWKEKRNLFDEQESAYKNAAVGLIARDLTEGGPCPVCGSLEHPQIARITENIPEEKDLKRLKEEYIKAEKAKEQSYNKALVQKGLVDNKEEEWNKVREELGLSQIEYVKAKEELNDSLKEQIKRLQQVEETVILLTNQLTRKKEINQSLVSLEEKRIAYIQERDLTQTNYQKAKSELDRLSGTIDQIREKLPKDDKTLEEVAVELEDTREKIEALSSQILKIEETYALLKERVQKNQTLLSKGKEDLDELSKEVNKEQVIFHGNLAKYGFANEDEYQKALLEEAEYLKRKEFIEDYDKKLQRKTQQQHDLEKEAGGKELVDLSLLKETLNEMDAQKVAIQKDREHLVTRIQVNQKALQSIKQKWKEKEILEEEYGILKDLDDVTKGNNPDRVVFEHYVLSVYFEEVIQAANYRLSNMTGGRYELEKVSKVADARTKDSLDLEVLDNYTGKKRSVKTLSGGESFKAALSLALGLSDIVQNNAGGIQIDTLFIDEGFGSLDSESLDQALNTLMMLTEHNRLIGIISHVNELKERIDNQIIIEKSNYGSTLKIKV